MLAPSVPPGAAAVVDDQLLAGQAANCADIGRANASVPPPAGNGTIMVTGLAGQADCAVAAQGKRRQRRAAAAAQHIAPGAWMSMRRCHVCLLSCWIIYES